MFDSLSNNELSMIIGALKIASDTQREHALFCESKELATIYNENAKEYENILNKIENEIKLKIKVRG